MTRPLLVRALEGSLDAIHRTADRLEAMRDNARNVLSGLDWLFLGAHGNLRELPERLGYLTTLEAAHLALISERNWALEKVDELTVDFEEQAQALGEVRAECHAQEGARRAAERGHALLVAQLEVARGEIERLRRRLEAPPVPIEVPQAGDLCIATTPRRPR